MYFMNMTLILVLIGLVFLGSTCFLPAQTAAAFLTAQTSKDHQGCTQPLEYTIIMGRDGTEQ
jgi:hypothetical protein